MTKAKFLVIIALSLFISFYSMKNADASGIGIKGGWATMRDDYDALQYENTYTVGIYFDMGKFLFNNLNFRPSLDYIRLKDKDNTRDIRIYGIHLDWYYHFMGQSKIAPYFGIGAALNVFSNRNNNKADDDSDAGMELFIGTDINLTGSVSLMLEGRYCFNDIANFNQNMIKVLAGFMLKF